MMTYRTVFGRGFDFFLGTFECRHHTACTAASTVRLVQLCQSARQPVHSNAVVGWSATILQRVSGLCCECSRAIVDFACKRERCGTNLVYADVLYCIDCDSTEWVRVVTGLWAPDQLTNLPLFIMPIPTVHQCVYVCDRRNALCYWSGHYLVAAVSHSHCSFLLFHCHYYIIDVCEFVLSNIIHRTVYAIHSHTYISLIGLLQLQFYIPWFCLWLPYLCIRSLIMLSTICPGCPRTQQRSTFLCLFDCYICFYSDFFSRKCTTGYAMWWWWWRQRRWLRWFECLYMCKNVCICASLSLCFSLPGCDVCLCEWNKMVGSFL